MLDKIETKIYIFFFRKKCFSKHRAFKERRAIGRLKETEIAD